MQRLRVEGKLDLCISPIYSADERALKMCFFNARSFHKHINGVRADLNYLTADVSIFSETRFRHADSSTMYGIDHHTLFRNDDGSNSTVALIATLAIHIASIEME